MDLRSQTTDMLTDIMPDVVTTASSHIYNCTQLVNSTRGSTSITVQRVLYLYFTPCLCLFGFLGNSINIFVLSQRTSPCLRDSMEKAACVGLVALAVSDMGFCLSILPMFCIDVTSNHLELYTSPGFTLHYTIYYTGLINTFITSSTYLTAYLALARCLAICFPLSIRALFKPRIIMSITLVIFLVAILCNLPRYWYYGIHTIDCDDGTQMYHSWRSSVSGDNRHTYTCLYFTLCVISPLLVMMLSNTFLIRELRQTRHRQREFTRSSGSDRQSNEHIITLTLILIVLLYILLVVPSEMMNFFPEVAGDTFKSMDAYNLVLAFMNSLQAINFSFNFVLYCVLNPHFRRMVGQMFQCGCRKNSSSTYTKAIVKIENDSKI